MAVQAKSNAKQKAILKQILAMEAYVAKHQNMKNQNALVRAAQDAGRERMRELWAEYKAAA